jgi:hypothetical protein
LQELQLRLLPLPPPSAFSCLSSFYLIIIIISSLAFRALHFLGFASVFGLGSCGVLGLDGHGVAFFVIVQALGK